MGNAHTTANEAVLSFFAIYIAVFAVAVAAAIRVAWLTGGKWFKCGERPRRSSGVVITDQDGRSWYEQLHKTRVFPGTLAYIITWALVFFLEAYGAWRVWINVPAQQHSYGIAYLYLVIFHVLVNGLASELLFGLQNLTYGLIGYVLSLVFSTVALTMLALLTFETSLLPSVTVFVLQCISTTGVLAVVVCVIVLKVKNPRNEYEGFY